MADLIDKLPIDNTPIDTNEMLIIEDVFKPENVNKIVNVAYNTRDILIAGIVFLIVSLPIFQSILIKLIPITKNSDYIGIAIKTSAFMVLLFFINNFYLIKK